MATTCDHGIRERRNAILERDTVERAQDIEIRSAKLLGVGAELRFRFRDLLVALGAVAHFAGFVVRQRALLPPKLGGVLLHFGELLVRLQTTLLLVGRQPHLVDRVDECVQIECKELAAGFDAIDEINAIAKAECLRLCVRALRQQLQGFLVAESGQGDADRIRCHEVRKNFGVLLEARLPDLAGELQALERVFVDQFGGETLAQCRADQAGRDAREGEDEHHSERGGAQLPRTRVSAWCHGASLGASVMARSVGGYHASFHRSNLGMPAGWSCSRVNRSENPPGAA